MKEIPLTRGYVALVDDEDYERLAAHKWRVFETPRTNYAVRHGDGKKRKLQGTVLMHREILGSSKGQDTDHIDHDGLNNQRSNIRECTRQENLRNRRSNLGSSSQFKGISWCKADHRWHAAIGVGHQTVLYIGSFTIETDAADAYKQAAASVFGEFAAGVSGDNGCVPVALARLQSA